MRTNLDTWVVVDLICEVEAVTPLPNRPTTDKLIYSREYMPPKRRRAKGDGEASSQSKQPDTSAKRRKKQEGCISGNVSVC